MARNWGGALWVMSLLDCMVDEVSKPADHQIRLVFGEQDLRLQTPLNYGLDDMDDALRANICNLKQTARELIKREEAGLNYFMRLTHIDPSSNAE